MEWSGSFTAPKTGSYKFSINADGGVRVYVSNVRIINEWGNKKDQAFTGSINLIEGNTYPIIVEYKENKSNGIVQLKWTVPTQIIQIIDRKSTRLNSSHLRLSRMPSSA